MVRALEAVYHVRPEYPARAASSAPEPAVPQLQLLTGERRRP
jgi:hypothetical protein